MEEFRRGPAKFTYARNLLDALRSNKKDFEVKEWFDHKNSKVWNLEKFEDTLDKGYYSVLQKFTLHPAVEYVNYDSQHHHDPAGKVYIKSMSSSHLEHCAHSRDLNTLASLKEDSAFVASSHGAWNKDHTENKDQQLVFSHRVLTVTHKMDSSTGHHCTRVLLEKLHPWELFTNVNIQALAEHPFDNTYTAKQQVPEEGERHLQQAVPDSPLKSCSDPKFAEPGSPTFIRGDSVRLGRNTGCAMFSRDVPGSFAANYDAGKGGAAETYTWGVISCDNCFAVLGAGALAVVNYDVDWSQASIIRGNPPGVKFAAQVKLAGNAGAAVALKGSAGTVSASRDFQMANRGSPSGWIPLGTTGLTLNIAFASASFKISGSADFEGSFSVSWGALGRLSLSGMYNNGFNADGLAQWNNLNRPFQNNGFRMSAWTVNGEVLFFLSVPFIPLLCPSRPPTLSN